MQRTLSAMLLLSAVIASGTACARKVDVDAVKDTLRRGEEHQKLGQFKSAIASFRIGLNAVGRAYESPNVLDDTGQNETLAGISEHSGKLSESAALYHGILLSRLSMYEAKVGHNEP